MASENWFQKLKAVLFTQFEKKVKDALNGSYADIFFTIEEDNTEPTKLPTVFFSELTPIETGNNIDNVSVNALYETIQITVYSNERSDVKKIMDACVLAMKSLRFNITGFPIYETNHDIKFGVARFRRLIAEHDFF